MMFRNPKWLDITCCFLCSFCLINTQQVCHTHTVWPYWAIFWTLGNFSKPVGTISLPKSSTFFGIFVKVSKSIIFEWNHFWATLKDIWWLFTGHTVLIWHFSTKFVCIKIKISICPYNIKERFEDIIFFIFKSIWSRRFSVFYWQQCDQM